MPESNQRGSGECAVRAFAYCGVLLTETTLGKSTPFRIQSWQANPSHKTNKQIAMVDPSAVRVEEGRGGASLHGSTYTSCFKSLETPINPRRLASRRRGPTRRCSPFAAFLLSFVPPSSFSFYLSTLVICLSLLFLFPPLLLLLSLSPPSARVQPAAFPASRHLQRRLSTTGVTRALRYRCGDDMWPVAGQTRRRNCSWCSGCFWRKEAAEDASGVTSPSISSRNTFAPFLVLW